LATMSRDRNCDLLCYARNRCGRDISYRCRPLVLVFGSSSGIETASIDQGRTSAVLSLDFAPTKGSLAESEADSAADWAAGARRASPASSSTTAPKLPAKTRGIGRNDRGGATSRLRTTGTTERLWLRPSGRAKAHGRRQDRCRDSGPDQKSEAFWPTRLGQGGT
jgi:hypothetical protein